MRLSCSLLFWAMIYQQCPPINSQPTDQCPDDPNKLFPMRCGCGVAETDSDGDGTPDCVDVCPLDPVHTLVLGCGCGEPETDTDGDGYADCRDACIYDPLKFRHPGFCGCGFPETDTDGDGMPDCDDDCPLNPNKLREGACGCDESEVDSDGDGIPDCIDICPNSPENHSAYCGTLLPCDDLQCNRQKNLCTEENGDCEIAIDALDSGGCNGKSVQQCWGSAAGLTGYAPEKFKDIFLCYDDCQRLGQCQSNADCKNGGECYSPPAEGFGAKFCKCSDEWLGSDCSIRTDFNEVMQEDNMFFAWALTTNYIYFQWRCRGSVWCSTQMGAEEFDTMNNAYPIVGTVKSDGRIYMDDTVSNGQPTADRDVPGGTYDLEDISGWMDGEFEVFRCRVPVNSGDANDWVYQANKRNKASYAYGTMPLDLGMDYHGLDNRKFLYLDFSSGVERAPSDMYTEAPPEEPDGLFVPGYTCSAKLPDAPFKLFWSFSDDGLDINLAFGGSVPIGYWLGFAFAPGPSMDGGDAVIALSTGEMKQYDLVVSPNNAVIKSWSRITFYDHSQEEVDGFLVMKFSRPLNTGDQNDMIISADSQNTILWSYGRDVIPDGHSQRGYEVIDMGECNGGGLRPDDSEESVFVLPSCQRLSCPGNCPVGTDEVDGVSVNTCECKIECGCSDNIGWCALDDPCESGENLDLQNLSQYWAGVLDSAGLDSSLFKVYDNQYYYDSVPTCVGHGSGQDACDFENLFCAGNGGEIFGWSRQQTDALIDALENNGYYSECPHECETEESTVESSTVSAGDTFEWTVGDETYDDITLSPGETVTFNYYAGAHDVYQLPNEQDFLNCDFTNAVMLADLEDTPYTFEATNEQSGRSIYIACSVSGHCYGGQKIIIHVTGTPIIGAGDAFIWTAAIGADPYNDITLSPGEMVTFDFYAGAHDVYQFPNQQDFANCDFSNAVMLADDDDTPYVFVASADQSGTSVYIGCSVPGHCFAGQKIIIHITGTQQPPQVTDAPSPQVTDAPSPRGQGGGGGEEDQGDGEEHHRPISDCKDSASWNSEYGDCSSYEEGERNNPHCLEDYGQGVFYTDLASIACPVACDSCDQRCLEHADCDPTSEYCDTNHFCWSPCSDCLAYTDAIDGTCPNCAAAEKPLPGVLGNNQFFNLACGNSVSGSTRGQPNVYGDPSGDSLFRFSLNATDTVVFDACQSNFDTYLYVLNDQFSQVLCECDDCGSCGTKSALQCSLNGPGTYFLVLGGYDTSEGDFSLDVICPNESRGCCEGGTSTSQCGTVAVQSVCEGRSICNWTC